MKKLESKKYRDSLAKKLKNIRKSNPMKATEVLNKEKSTNAYKIARKIKLNTFK